MTQVFFSNQLEHLAEFLAKKNFQEDSSPLLKRFIVVDSGHQKRFLQSSFAEKFGICAGVTFFTLQEAYQYFYSKHFQKKIPNQLELYCACLQQLTEIQDETVRNYLNGNRSRLLSLVQIISNLFWQYGIYCDDINDWQEIAWKNIFCAKDWTYPLNVIKDPFPSADSKIGQIHFFNITSLPLSYGIFFEKLAALYSIAHYLLSPCKYYWADFASDYEMKKMQKKAPEKIRASLDKYLADRNPILANFGKLGREYLRFLGEWDFHEEDKYIENEENSLLGALRNNLLQAEQKFTFPTDDSLQIHQSGSSILQELQVLSKNIAQLFNKHPDLQPKDILVLAPDIKRYIPYIHFVFGSFEAYKIYGTSLLQESPILAGLLHFLDLSWNVYDVLQLLQNSSFQDCYHLTSEEAQTLKDWIMQARIYSNLDEAHSWKKGKERLLLNLVMASDTNNIELSKSDLLNKLFQIIANLEEDYYFLSQNPSFSLLEWTKQLQKLKEKYFAVKDDVNGNQVFENVLLEMKKANGDFIDQTFDFLSVKELLKKEFQTAKGQYQGFLANAITFSSLEKGAILPSSVICALGMDEDNFPKAETPLSLNLMKDKTSSKQEEQRYLFLQLLLSAKKHLIFSYSQRSSEDGKPAQPSLFLQELKSYINGSEIKHVPNFTPNHHQSSFAFQMPKENQLKNDLIIDLKDLTKLAKHPIQFYLNQALGIYLEENELEKYESQQFALSSLDKFLFLQKALNEKDGAFPVGIFGEVAKNKLKKEQEKLEKKLSELNIEKLSSIILTPTCKNPVERIGFLEYPAISIELENKKVQIVGEIPFVSEQGLLIRNDYNFQNTLKKWPLILAYQILGLNTSILFCNKKAVCKNWSIPDPKSALANFVSYYLVAQKNIMPFMPQWVEGLIYKDAKDLFSDRKKAADRYLEWLLSTHKIEPLSKDDWLPLIHSFFSPLISLFDDAAI